MKKLLLFLMLLPLPAWATQYEVIQAGGGDYTTITDCIAAATSPGDICNVHAATYSETITPGTSGTYASPIMIQANGADVVNVTGVSFDSVDHVQIKNILVGAITRQSVTFTFDNYYQIGMFANEDWWVIGPVTINTMTPAYDSHENGWMVDPSISGKHAFSDTCKLTSDFDMGLVPSLPYTSVSSVESIVKAVSSASDQACLTSAVVLTVVASAPANNGSTVFRPPYFDTTKTMYNVGDLNTDLLPSLVSVGTPPALSVITSDFANLRPEFLLRSGRRDIRATDAYPMSDGYSPSMSDDNHEDILRLFLSDALADKMFPLIMLMQHGIDQAHMAIEGWDDFADDGHDPGHRILMAFAAEMLDISGATTALLAADNMHEEHYSQTSVNGDTLWGESGYTELQYWTYIIDGSGGKSNKDPYGFIDGGKATAEPDPPYDTGLASYQRITSQSWKGTMLVGTLMPEIQDSWPSSYWASLKNYAERFVTYGSLFQPDPCAPYDGTPANYGVTFGPDADDTPFDCILDADLDYFNSATDFACSDGQECGRYPTSDNQEADEGQNKSDFVAAMWTAYYDLGINCDIDGDSDVDSSDISYLVDVIQGRESSVKGDLNSDASKDILDVMILVRVVNSDIACPE